MAIIGEGFFAVQTPGGKRLTRNGAFHLDPTGRLTTQKGEPVLGERGPIALDPRRAVSIAADGQIFQDRQRVDRLRILQLPPAQTPQKVGNTLFLSDGAQPATNFRVQQRSLESANVSVVQEMVAMIAGLRAYEAAQRAVQAQDDTLGRAVNDIPKI